MTADDSLARSLNASPVIAILRDVSAHDASRISSAAVAQGIRCLEVTIETARGRDALVALAAAFASDEGVVVGAGTVRTVEDVAFAASVGAAFTVSPGLDLRVLAAARARGVLHLPGVATPSEILAAIDAGATLLKAFPAAVLGPVWLRSMAGPFPDVRFVATGGVSASNAPDYLDAGAIAVGISLRDDPLPVLADLQTRGLLTR